MAQAAQADSRPPLIAVAVASGAALAYQILLLRLFSIVQFHHTAYMVISLALLGYGASGSALTLWRGRWLRRFEDAFRTCLVLFAIAAVACFAAAQRIGIHPEEMLWRPRQAVWLLVVYLVLAVPFLFVGAAIGLALMRLPATRIYAADLIGAGIGTGLVVGLLWLMTPGQVLRVLAIVSLAAALISDWELRRWSWRRLGALGAVAAMLLAAPADWIEPQPSEYKGLSQVLRVHGTRLVEERSGPLGLVSVVESPQVPLRHAPGLSLAVPAEPPEQIGLFLDAEVLLPVTRWREGSTRLDYLDYATQALPYALIDPETVLVLGAGGGEEVARGRYYGVRSTVAVEINPDVVDLVDGRYREFSGDLYRRSGVEVQVRDVRGFISHDRRRFDLVVLGTVSGYGGGGPALASLSEDYLLTVEAFDSYLDKLTDGGLLTATVFLTNPPRASVKLVASVIAALEGRGVADPAASLAVIRSWQTATLVVKRGQLTPEEVARVREFADRRLFDLVHLEGLEAEELNRHNLLPQAPGSVLPHEAVARLLGPDRGAFFERYKFAVRPATDDRPFFHQFFRWRALPEIIASRGSGGLSLLEAGYLVLVVTLGAALVTALLLVLAPLLVLRSAPRRQPRLRVVVYFSALGLGFLLIEVAFLQQLILVLHHPVYSAAVVISGFLLFAGLGSWLAPRAERRWSRRAIFAIVGAIVAVGLLDIALLAAVSSTVAGMMPAVQIAFAVLIIAPLALLMGMPFPLGLQALKRADEQLVPWAWAINGCASVVSPILATLMAVHWGFRTVVAVALVAYTVAAGARPGGAR